MSKSLVSCFLSVTNFTFTYSESSYEIVISQSMNSLIHIQHDYTACVNNVDFRLLVSSIRLNGWRRGVVVSRVRRLN